MICPYCKYIVFEVDVFSKIPNAVRCETCGANYDTEEMFEYIYMRLSEEEKKLMGEKNYHLVQKGKCDYEM